MQLNNCSDWDVAQNSGMFYLPPHQNCPPPPQRPQLMNYPRDFQSYPPRFEPTQFAPNCEYIPRQQFHPQRVNPVPRLVLSRDPRGGLDYQPLPASQTELPINFDSDRRNYGSVEDFETNHHDTRFSVSHQGTYYSQPHVVHREMEPPPLRPEGAPPRWCSVEPTVINSPNFTSRPPLREFPEVYVPARSLSRPPASDQLSVGASFNHNSQIAVYRQTPERRFNYSDEQSEYITRSTERADYQSVREGSRIPQPSWHDLPVPKWRYRSRSPVHRFNEDRPSYQQDHPKSEHIDYRHQPAQHLTDAPAPLFSGQKALLASATASSRISSESLLNPPGRRTRPSKILLILRGLPGSGKSTLARLIKAKEIQFSEKDGEQPAIRLLSMDDFFMVENEARGASAHSSVYVYEAEMEEVYQKQLVKLACRQMDNGFFNFIIVDGIFQRAVELDELSSQARTRSFQVYVIEVTANLSTCIHRSEGRRSREDICRISKDWEPTPSRYIVVDANSLQQEVSTEEVEMEADEYDPLQSPCDTTTVSDDDRKHSVLLSPPSGDEDDKDASESSSLWSLMRSKWDNEDATQRMERLDGLSRRLHHSASSDIISMAEYINADEGQFRQRKAGVKRVTWADIEALRSKSRRRELGFVLGQTDWSQMTNQDDTETAVDALIRTRYI